MPPSRLGLILPASFGGPATVPQQGSEDRRRTERQYLKYAALGTQFALTITLFALGGMWLDGKFDTEPIFTVVCSLVGIIGGMISLIYKVK